jgi:carboxylesterase type B
VSADALLSIARHVPQLRPVNFIDWIPVIDGVELAKQPQDLGNEGVLAPGVPILLGTNANEGTEFTNIPVDANQTDYTDYLAEEPIFSGQVERILAVYNGSDPEPQQHPKASTQWWDASFVIGDMLMVCAARRTARWLSSRPGPNVSTYLYHFERKLDATAPIELARSRPMGVFHGSELALVFRFEELLLAASERELGRNVERFWTNFAKTGVPTDEKTWPAFTSANDLTLRLDTGPLVAQPNLTRARCDFWDLFEPSVPP